MMGCITCIEQFYKAAIHITFLTIYDLTFITLERMGSSYSSPPLQNLAVPRSAQIGTVNSDKTFYTHVILLRLRHSCLDREDGFRVSRTRHRTG